MFSKVRYGNEEFNGMWGKDNEESMKEEARMMLNEIKDLNIEVKKDEYVDYDKLGRADCGSPRAQETSHSSRTGRQEKEIFLMDGTSIQKMGSETNAKKEGENMSSKPDTNGSQEVVRAKDLFKPKVSEKNDGNAPERLSRKNLSLPTKIQSL